MFISVIEFVSGKKLCFVDTSCSSIVYRVFQQEVCHGTFLSQIDNRFKGACSCLKIQKKIKCGLVYF